MSHSILLRGAKQLLTLRGKPSVRRGSDLDDLAIIEDGSVFIQRGKIVAVGPTRRLENLKEVQGAIDIPVHNYVVMPGFVDPYIQVRLAVPRPAGGVKRRRLSEFNSEILTLARACLQHGTLNAGISASAGLSTLTTDLSVLRELTRMRNNPIGLMRRWCPDYAGQSVREAISTIVKRRLATSIEVKGNENSEAWKNLDLPLNLNWPGGTPDELQAVLRGLDPVSVFCRHNLSAGECAVLAGSKSTAVFKAGEALLDLNPGDSLCDLIAAGGGIALGSGYDAVSEQNYNMQLVVALAVRRLHLTIEQAIVATTINAAYALDCGAELGSLEPGKRADLLVLNLSDYREIPRRLAVNHVALAIREGILAINRTRWKVGAA